MIKSRISITLRLALIYIIFACTLLLLTIASLYLLLIYRLQEEKYALLKNELIILQRILHTEAPHNLPNRLFEEIVTEPPMYHYYIRLLDEKGNTLIETPHMGHKIPLKIFPNITKQFPGTPIMSHWQDFLLLSASTSSPMVNEPKLYLQLAMNIFSEQTEHPIFLVYRRDMLLIWLISTIVAVITGIILIRNGLHPLHEMAHRIQHITITELTKRFDPTEWPQELAIFAQAFNSMLERIESGFAKLSRFSADLAHELRTPITNLMGEAEIALVRPRSNQDYCETLESSLEELTRLKRIIENLLFLARAENPHKTLNFVAVDLASLIMNILDFYEATAEEKSITLHYQGNATIQAEPILLRQAISNLINNALQHTPNGGKIDVVIETIEKEIRILITDTGEGIPPEHLPYLFDRFYRVDSARAHHTGGTGLGLAIVKTIIELHQAKIEVASSVNQCTTFKMIFINNNPKESS